MAFQENPPNKEGNYYRLSIDDSKKTSVYVPREQHTSLGEAIDILLSHGIGTVYSKIEIDIW